ncbi:serine hydrolase domain-containing protein [Nocardia sp. NPDC051570]|uniref:serine hydrolase domain-containing protein n=1 Tax=Nocardia sp. NPDC051570 TaxID=3364324 RepID=UPI003788B57D
MRRIVVAIVTAAVLTGWTGTEAAAGPPGADRAALQQAMNDLVTQGAAGVQLRLHDAQGEWTGSAGVAEVGRPEGVPTDGRFRIGSISKTFLATVMLQLVGEGRLGLDDPVARYLPQFGLDPRITVRMLLQHTSGLFNYTGELSPDGTLEPGLIPPSGKDAVEVFFRDHTPEELVRIATSKPARFAPGTDWRYSNTNYVLAALLIEKLTGTPYAAQIYGRIILPLGLWGTMLPGHWPGILGPYAHGYDAYKQDDTLKAVDFTNQNPSWAYGAGEIISTTQDLDTFITALLGSRLLAPAQLAEMRDWRTVSPGGAYGLGLMHVTRGPDCDYIGHNGEVPGYNSDLLSTTDGTTRVELSMTHGPGIDQDDIHAVLTLLEATDKVATLALCGN